MPTQISGLTGVDKIKNGSVTNEDLALTTPAQFDNGTSPATTGFVQRALGNLRGFSVVSTNTTISAADIGGAVLANASSAFTITLPSAGGLPAGANVRIYNVGTAAVNVQRDGPDVIATISTESFTALEIQPGSYVDFSIQGTTWWAAGSGALQKSRDFQRSFVANGYQKLPSGLIIQWGTFNVTNTNSTFTFNYPIAFPNAVFQTLVSTKSLSGSDGAEAFGAADSISLSQFQLRNYYNASGLQFSVLAVGY